MTESSLEKLKNDMQDTRNEMRTVMVLLGEEFARLHSKIEDVNKNVVQTNYDVIELQRNLAAFALRFEFFVQQIEKENNLTHAQGEVVILNQEIEKKFGLYDKVRKALLGILQSVDTGLVSKSSITYATEKLMLGTPRYWLTPSLIALAAWLNNDKDLALKGLNEGLKRNLVKTELMFTLINNRLKRNTASFIWLSKYFESQNPLSMPQETVVLLGAYTDGIFGPDSHGICRKQIKKWLNFLSREEDRVKSLEKTWYNKIDLLEISEQDALPFQYLQKYCAEWESIDRLLTNAKKQKSFLTYLTDLIEAKDNKRDYKVALDDLLFKLVNDFDTDEFELKKKKALAELIIKYQGDKEKAQQDFDTNTVILFNEQVSFFDILVNSINQTDMSPSLRRLSLLLMKEWVINAHNDYTANYRKTYPGFITIKLGDCSGKTKDGSNVNELLKNYNDFLSDNFSKAMKQIWQPLLIETFFLFITLIWMLLSSFSGFSIFLTGVLGFIVIKDIIKYFITRINLKYEWQNNYEMARKIFHAFCAEYVDWQNAFKKADKVYIEVSKLLTSYKSAEFTANSAGKKIITDIQVK